jgi:diguanylate cyclase (GGDEF)-like protein/PAS domain S-box-containing protein
LDGKTASISSRPRFFRGAKRNFAARLGGCFLTVCLATAAITSFEKTDGGINLIWVANGVLLAYLLLAPRWRWPAYAAAGFAALLIGKWVAGEPWPTNLLFNFLNMLEVLTSALLLRTRSAQLPRFTQLKYLLRFVAIAVLATPLAVGILFTLVTSASLRSIQGYSFIDWVVTDSLGIAGVTPICAGIFQNRFRNSVRKHWNWVLIPVLAATTFAAFYKVEIPALFLIYPLLVLILLQMGLSWASVATLYVAIFSGWCTVHRIGPFALTSYLSPTEPSILLQVYSVSNMFMLYAVTVVLEGRQATERRLQKIVALHNLVTENSRDAIIISDFKGRPSYISPSMRNLGGWSPEEIMAQEPLELAHPNDLENVNEALRELLESIDSTVIELRLRTRKGDYIWIECSMRVYRDPATGKRAGVLNLVRNIGERKRAEQELQAAYTALESMAVVDALTGLANRRRFDAYLTAEWRREMRDIKPLSLLMLDADYFKSYNDAYGHVRGDSCLKQIAEACMDVVARPGDLVARYGGEEFAIILPETDNAGALQVGREICDALRSRKLKHPSNPAGCVTISIGCATVIPQRGHHATDLIETADKALYQAKHCGRDQVCNANEMENPVEASTPEEIPAGAGPGV